MKISKLIKLLFIFLFFLCTILILILTSSDLNYSFINSYFNQTKSNFSFEYSSKQNQSPYLWCVNHYGPNNQLKDFVKCCILAMINNYTLIIPPLYPHYGDHLRGIQWFDHFYDLKQLNKILNYITFDQLIMKNQNKKIFFFDCYIQQIELVQQRTWYSLNALKSIENYYNIKLIFHQYVNLSRNFNNKDLYEKSNNCSSIFLHIHYTTFGHYFTTPNQYTQIIFKHLHRNPLIQRMTLELIKFLPHILINKKSSKIKYTTLAVAHMRLGDFTVMNFSKYIEQILYLIKINVRFTHLHIMCPYLNMSHIEELKQNLPVPFTTTQQILPHVRYIFDDYLFDVFEQELAYQAPIFIASPWTTYSATVLMQKVYQQKGIVYLFSSKPRTNPFLITKTNVRYY